KDFVAAAPLRSLPYLLGWTLDSLPSLATQERNLEDRRRIGWVASSPPPAGGPGGRDAPRLAGDGPGAGDDSVATPRSARLGVPPVLLLAPSADWLWGPHLGPSRWYPALEVLRAADSEGLAARLAAIGA